MLSGFPPGYKPPAGDRPPSGAPLPPGGGLGSAALFDSLRRPSPYYRGATAAAAAATLDSVPTAYPPGSKAASELPTVYPPGYNPPGQSTQAAALSRATAANRKICRSAALAPGTSVSCSDATLAPPTVMGTPMGTPMGTMGTPLKPPPPTPPPLSAAAQTAAVDEALSPAQPEPVRLSPALTDVDHFERQRVADLAREQRLGQQTSFERMRRLGKQSSFDRMQRRQRPQK